MSFLKTLFWVIFLVGFTVFAINNWHPVSVRLWGGMWLDTKLPALIGLSFLLGFVPLFILHKTQGFRMRRRIATLEGNRPLASLNMPQSSTAPTIGAI